MIVRFAIDLKGHCEYDEAKRGDSMYKMIFGLVALVVGSSAFAAPTCDGNVAYYTMLNYAKTEPFTVRSPALKPTNLRIYPNIQVDGSSLNDSMIFVATGDPSGQEVVGYVEFDRKQCQIAPKVSGIIQGQDIPL